jgi:hypothetical protein
MVSGDELEDVLATAAGASVEVVMIVRMMRMANDRVPAHSLRWFTRRASVVEVEQ